MLTNRYRCVTTQPYRSVCRQRCRLQLMCIAGLVGYHRRRSIHITQSDKTATVQPRPPLVADITYLAT